MGGPSEEVIQELIAQASCNKTDIENLKRWQGEQNGSIHRVESKVDDMFKQVAGFGWKFSVMVIGVAVQVILTLVVLKTKV